MAPNVSVEIMVPNSFLPQTDKLFNVLDVQVKRCSLCLTSIVSLKSEPFILRSVVKMDTPVRFSPTWCCDFRMHSLRRPWIYSTFRQDCSPEVTLTLSYTIRKPGSSILINCFTLSLWDMWRQLTECYMKLEATTIARIGREVLFKETFGQFLSQVSVFVHEISSRY